MTVENGGWMKYIAMLSVVFLCGCIPENNCGREGYQNKVRESFGFCMDNAAKVAREGTHDNSYNTIEECKSFAYNQALELCFY